jgi:ferritin-like metal-binding protein YciE
MVHSSDVGEAYRLAVLRDVAGAFNIAADPPIDSDALAEVLEAGTFPLPTRLARALADLSWRLRLQPSPPGWLDMAKNVPLLSSRRAASELGWTPRFSGIETLAEVIEGMREKKGFPTPPLEEEPIERRLVKHLADAHSIEEQALTQLRAAPRIAGDARLAEIFERHLDETEAQERRVRERLEALSADPSRIKDLAGRAGGVGMVVFARSQPDTPGKLTAHAYSYEHMELAAYMLLREAAEHAGDEETVRMAEEIAAEERQMAERLEVGFDAAVEASLARVPSERLDEQVDRYLADVHAIEQQALQMLRSGLKQVDDEQLESTFAGHLEETTRHRQMVEERLEARGGRPSMLKDAALRLGAINLGGFFGAQPDTTTKLAGFAFAFEHLEIASYELLKRVAQRAGDEQTVSMAEKILAEERSAAAAVASTWERPGIGVGA